MSNDCWVVVADEGPIGGMVAAARGLGGSVTAIVVGPRALADDAAANGPDAVRWIPVPDGLAPEAFAGAVAGQAASAAPRALLCLADGTSRVIWAAAAERTGATPVGAVTSLRLEGEVLVVTQPVAAGKAVATIEVQGPVAGVFDGADVVVASPVTAVAEVAEVVDATATPGVRFVRMADEGEAGASGLRKAERVVSVGLGIRDRAGIAVAERLAAVLGAELACSLPVSEELHLFDDSRVIGLSSNQIKPQLYVALGISGQPQHLSGMQDAKVVVAVNTDPAAPIFSRCDLGIRGDLREVVPALVAALEHA